MKVVTDTGPLIWLERVGYGPEFHKIYPTVWAPPGVESELKENWRKTAKIWPSVKIPTFTEKEGQRFGRLVRRWMRRHDYPEKEKTDVEVIVLYREFVDADEILYANQGAERTFGKFGRIRDVYQIYESAMRQKVWTKEDSEMYLKALLKLGYRNKQVSEALKKL